jgi:hypothetical protein
MAAKSREQKIVEEAFSRFFTATEARLQAVNDALGNTNIPDVPERKTQKRRIPAFIAQSPFRSL